MKIKILIVDDEAANVALLESLLQPQGYGIMKAGDGDEALRIIFANELDLVLLDVRMPGKSGFDVLEEVRKNERTKTIPVILLTALSGREDRLRGIDAGADDFISKPFDRAELLSRVRTQAGLSVLRRQVNEKEKLSGIMDMMKEGAVVTDGDLMFRYVNDTVREMLEIKEITGSLEAHLREKFGFVIDCGAEKGKFILKRPGSAAYGPIFLSAEYRRVDRPGGGTDSYVFVFKDVTEEYTRNKMKADFLSLITHKLRTPLTVISGYAKLLGALAPDAKVRDTAMAIGHNSAIMENLVQRILYFVEIENTASTGSGSLLDLKEITGRFASYYKKTFELIPAQDAVNVQYWQKIAAEELIENAFKFNDKEKLILSVRAGEEGLTVEDNGPGIPAGEREKVFETFYQGYKNFTGNTAGAGLGLSIVKRLAESNNCAVRLETGGSGGLKVVISKKTASDAGQSGGDKAGGRELQTTLPRPAAKIKK
jgi:DNA-binding response OmpR family regulator/anti-sigma regulatory factor (Ser/Thr protein kinase)